jgi:N-acetylglucosamine-6-phosphate deacetylase
MNYYCNTTITVDIKLINAVVFDGEKEIKTTIHIRNGLFSRDEGTDYEIIDCKNEWVVPGFIDLQVYGGNGRLFSDEPTIESLERIVSGCMSGGATSILPTIATNSFETIYRCIDTVKKYREQKKPGILGLHLEGPFINPIKKGAHLENYIVRPDLDLAKELVDKAQGEIKIITLAPECCEENIIDFFIDNGIQISAGHSNAIYEQAKKSFKQNKTGHPPLQCNEPITSPRSGTARGCTHE